MMRFLSDNRYPCLKCLLMGVGFSVPYLVPQLFLLTYVSLTAFILFLLTESRVKRLFRYTFCFTLGFYTVLYSFLSSMYPFEGFGFAMWQSVLIATGACTLIPLLHSLLHSAIMLPLKLFSDRPIMFVLLLPCLWTVAEWALEYGMLGFPWGKMALSQTSFLLMLQTESLFGPYFITLIITAFCSLSAYAIRYGDRQRAFVSACLLLANLISGTVIYLQPEESVSNVTAAALQGNVSTAEKWSNNSVTSIVDNYNSLISEAADSGAKLIVLPESAVPVKYTVGGRTDIMLKTAAKNHDAVLICGVLRKGEKEYNSVIAVGKNGAYDGIYDKRHLVPFGEFIPFKDFLYTVLPVLSQMNLSGMKLSEGTDAVVFDTDAGKVGTLICFDSIFPSLAVDEVKSGAEIMTIVTNDSWFKDSAGTYQHARMAQLRAIECGRYFIQSGNTGVSEIIDSKGRVLASTKAMERGMCVGNVKLMQDRTLYTYIGNAVLYVAAALAAIIIIFRIGEIIYDYKKRKTV